jgi:hypothetical protein
MKIGQARQVYSAKLQEYWDQKIALAKKKKELEEKSNTASNGNKQLSHQAVTLELSYNAVSDKYEQYHKFMGQIMDIQTGIYNAEVAKQQGDTMSESAQDVAKIIEVARRISKGDKVPAADEKKLIEYSMVMYMSAKDVARMNEQKEKKQHESLWKDEKSVSENPDPSEVADNQELNLDAPELVDVADVMASAVGEDTSE